MRRKLTESVSLDELKRMYDNGMSCADIAKSIGVSNATIYKYLQGHTVGRNGGRCARLIPDDVIRPSHSANGSGAKEPENRNAEHACLVVEDRTVDLVGTIGRYVVNAKTRSALCSIGNTPTELSLETIPALIDELKALGRLGNTLNVGNEMW